MSCAPQAYVLRNFVFKLLVLNKKTLRAQLFPFQKLCIKRTTHGVTLFPISKFYTTTPHVHMFVLSLGLCTLRPRAQLVPFLGVVHAEQPM